jgi:hypothetical protein
MPKLTCATTLSKSKVTKFSLIFKGKSGVTGLAISLTGLILAITVPSYKVLGCEETFISRSGMSLLVLNGKVNDRFPILFKVGLVEPTEDVRKSDKALVGRTLVKTNKDIPLLKIVRLNFNNGFACYF